MNDCFRHLPTLPQAWSIKHTAALKLAPTGEKKWVVAVHVKELSCDLLHCSPDRWWCVTRTASSQGTGHSKLGKAVIYTVTVSMAATYVVLRNRDLNNVSIQIFTLPRYHRTKYIALVLLHIKTNCTPPVKLFYWSEIIVRFFHTCLWICLYRRWQRRVFLIPRQSYEGWWLRGPAYCWCVWLLWGGRCQNTWPSSPSTRTYTSSAPPMLVFMSVLDLSVSHSDAESTLSVCLWSEQVGSEAAGGGERGVGGFWGGENGSFCGGQPDYLAVLLPVWWVSSICTDSVHITQDQIGFDWWVHHPIPSYPIQCCALWKPLCS